MSQAMDTPAHIVVADDEPDLLEIVRFRLEREGLTVDTTSDGQKALELIREQHPALVLLDVMMPRMSGFDVANEIRNDPDLSDVRIIFLSARSHDHDIAHGFDLGAIDYLTKPFSPAELSRRVQAALSRPAVGR